MDAPNEQIDDVKGPRVDYTLTYANIATNMVYKILWRRHGTWTLVHGSQGWMLDDGSIEDDSIIGLIDNSGKRYSIDNDQEISKGQHTFTIPTPPYEAEYTYTRTSKGGWSVVFDKMIGVPTAVSTAQPDSTQQPSQSEPTIAPDVAPIPAPYVPPGGVNCEDDTIDTVADDGSIITMVSGAVYSVDAGDESTAAVWLASDDVLICNGEKIINKDEQGESVGVTLAQ